MNKVKVCSSVSWLRSTKPTNNTSLRGFHFLVSYCFFCIHFVSLRPTVNVNVNVKKHHSVIIRSFAHRGTNKNAEKNVNGPWCNLIVTHAWLKTDGSLRCSPALLNNWGTYRNLLSTCSNWGQVGGGLNESSPQAKTIFLSPTFPYLALGALLTPLQHFFGRGGYR